MGAEGPYVRWTDHGSEGWQPESFDTLDSAVRAVSYGSPWIVTRLIAWTAVEGPAKPTLVMRGDGG